MTTEIAENQAPQAEEQPIKKKKSPWRWLKRFIYLIIFLLVLIVGFVAFVIFTPQGLKLVDYALKKSPVNEMVQIDELRGTLWQGIQFDRLHLTLNEENYIELSNAELQWDLNKILEKSVTVKSLSVEQADIILTKPGEPTPPDPDATPFLPFSFKRGQLPIDITIDSVKAADVAVILPDLSVYVETAKVNDGVISQTTWAFKDVAYKGLLNIGDDVTLPLNATASIDANKETDAVNIRLKNSTREMRVGEDYFDHAMNILVTGTLNDLKVHDAITFNWPDMLAKPLVIETKLNIKNQADLSWDLTLFNISNQLATTGQWSLNNPKTLVANLDLYMTELKDIYPELTGSVKGDFSFAGDFKKPLLSGDITGRNIKGFGVVLDSFDIKADHNEAQTTAFTADLSQLKAQDITVKSGKIQLQAEKIEQFDFSAIIENIANKEKVIVDKVTLTSAGSLEEHDINLKVRSIFNTTDFVGIGHVNRENYKEWSLDINKLDVYSDIIGKYNLSKPAQLNVSPENIKLSLLCLQELPTTFCLEGQKTAAQSFGSVVIRRLQPKKIQSLLPPEMDINTTADMVIVGQFTNEKDFNGVVDLSLAEGHVRYRMQGYELNVPLKKTKVVVHAKPAEIMTQLDIDWGKYLQVHGGGTMKEPLGKQLVDVKVTGNAPTLDWILPIVPVLQKLDGKVDMKLETSGELSKGLDIGFNLDIANGEIYNAEYNSLIKNINLKVALQKGTPILSVDGGLLAGSGKMTLNGVIDLKTMESNIKVRGDSLLLADSTNVKAIASPNVDIAIKKGAATIRGNLLIPELKFLYKSSDDPRGSVHKVSEDTIVISSKRPVVEKKEPSKFWNNSTMDFKIVLGDNISVGAVGFVGKLMGSIDLKKSVNNPLTALGIINMGSGVYNVLGQELTLDKGKIQFTGLDIANPNIEFQASRMFENKRTGTKVSVGVRVTGTAQNPKVNLFSQPGMPTNSIVSYLALGSDVDSLTAVEMLQIAKMAQRIASGEIVTSNDNAIAKSVGLTDLGVMKDLSGNTSLGIGKYLTENFYVGIGMSIFEENNSAFALMRYNFLKYFSFDTQVSDEYSTMDLRYSKEI